MAKPPSGPGLAKVRKVQVITRRTLDVLAVREGWWSSVLEAGDIISEGEVVRAGGVETYFGSTSLRCPIEASLLTTSVVSPEQLGHIILADPHARLRLLRLAHREAASRASGPLDVLQAEMVARIVRDEGEAILSVDIDVSAPLVSKVAGRS